jgi:peptide/nickel transport system ATP-binding protein
MPGLLSVRELSVEYKQGGRPLRAVSSASFSLEAGHSMGLVGESGSGKTTLALSLMGLLPTNGRVSAGEIRYEDGTGSPASEDEWRQLRWTKVALIFQGGMNALNPVKRVLDQITEPMLIHHTEPDRGAAETRALELLEQVGIPKRRGRDYPHEYSGGMRQRACIAMALACRPNLLIADEPTTAIDVVVQAQIIALLAELRSSLGLAMLVITHDLGVVAQLCDEVLVMYAAEIIERASAADIFRDPLHPYTKLLLESVPSFAKGRRIGEGIPGQPPSLSAPPTGCRFHPRCPSVMARCATQSPTTTAVDERWVSCHLYGK